MLSPNSRMFDDSSNASLIGSVSLFVKLDIFVLMSFDTFLTVCDHCLKRDTSLKPKSLCPCIFITDSSIFLSLLSMLLLSCPLLSWTMVHKYSILLLAVNSIITGSSTVPLRIKSSNLLKEARSPS